MFSKILFYFLLVILVAGLIGYLTEPKEQNEGFEATTPQQMEEEAEQEETETTPHPEPTKAIPNVAQLRNIIKQEGVEVGNIFSPRITIRTADNNNLGSYYARADQQGDGYVIDLNLSNEDLQKIMSSNTNEGFNKSFELQKYKDWKKPATDLWKESFQDATTTPTATQDPWDTLVDNEARSKQQETKNDLLCYNILKAQDGVDTPMTKEDQDYAKSKYEKTERVKYYDSKDFHPGYQFVDPKAWDVPKQRPPVCIPQKEQLPSAVIMNGFGTNVLELDQTGRIATQEKDISKTNVGSILPKFQYQENYHY